jgi:hypothetical protein
MYLSSKLCFAVGATELPKQLRSQTEFGNEGKTAIWKSPLLVKTGGYNLFAASRQMRGFPIHRHPNPGAATGVIEEDEFFHGRRVEFAILA